MRPQTNLRTRGALKETRKPTEMSDQANDTGQNVKPRSRVGPRSISPELRKDIEEETQKHRKPNPIATGQDALNPQYLQKLFDLLSSQYRQEETITWGKLGREMRDATNLSWHEDRYRVLIEAVEELNRQMACNTGHMVSVGIVNRFKMEGRKFYDQATTLGLLPSCASAAQQKQFWLSEWEWWVGWARR
jgi:hypothetical protein